MLLKEIMHIILARSTNISSSDDVLANIKLFILDKDLLIVDRIITGYHRINYLFYLTDQQ